MMEFASVNTCRNYLQRRKRYQIMLQQAHIRFIEIVIVIEMDLEEKERATWTERERERG
jgi:hypothetical protein